MTLHESSPSSQADLPTFTSAEPGERTSAGLIVVWLLLAVPAALSVFFAFVGALISIGMSGLPLWVMPVALWTMLAVALCGIVVSLCHFGLVCSLRQSRVRSILVRVQSVYLAVLLIVGFGLASYAESVPPAH
ncbi:TMEM45 family protein [Nocardiopsis nanhaiensis]